MPRAPRIDFPDALYHVISRGNGRADIFWTDDDRLRFLRQLADGLQTAGVLLYAYVLMDNHFHLLVRTPRANLSRFMQRLGTSYALYCRYKHRKPGHQLEGRFKAKLVEDETLPVGSDPLYPPQSHQDGRLPASGEGRAGSPLGSLAVEQLPRLRSCETCGRFRLLRPLERLRPTRWPSPGETTAPTPTPMSWTTTGRCWKR